MKYIKLNTNESPYPPSKKAVKEANRAAKILNLYPDPQCRILTEKIAESIGVDYENVLVTNGSDEILNFAFMAFCDKEHSCVFPDITYGFYCVFAEINGVEYEEIPLKEDFSICPEDYIGINKNIFIANPNAPTGIVLTLSKIEEIVKSNPDNVVVIDEAYVDFGNESAIPLTKKYDNLLVTQTFSKSRSMAGARIGFGVGNKELIRDLNTIKYSTNPYNINKMSMAAGVGVMNDEAYTKKNCKKVISAREYAERELKKLGFEMTQSGANFVFVKHPQISGGEIYQKLREKGILVRHFDKERISEYNRITIGTQKQMETLIDIMGGIVK
jgi:histidinol-phosphate aminotransferase